MIRFSCSVGERKTLNHSFENWLSRMEGRFAESVTPECFNRGSSSGFLDSR
jgi:hypothetical protein